MLLGKGEESFHAYFYAQTLPDLRMLPLRQSRERKRRCELLFRWPFFYALMGDYVCMCIDLLIIVVIIITMIIKRISKVYKNTMTDRLCIVLFCIVLICIDLY